MTIIIKKIDNSFIQFKNLDKSILSKFKEAFTFKVPGSFFLPSVKSGYWDGKICLYDFRKNTLPLGLAKDALKIIKKHTHDIICDLSIFEKGYSVTEKEILDFCNVIKLPFKPYDHQIETVIKCMKEKRLVITSATNSGKSFSLFLITNLLKLRNENEKILIIVPMIQLVEQMSKDFIEYAKNHHDFGVNIKKIYSGIKKDKSTSESSNKNVKLRKKQEPFITISTYQSLQNISKKDKTYLESFTTIISDECHRSTGDVISSIIEKCVKAEYKIGVTGSLTNEKIHTTQLKGLFGPVENIINAREMIDKGMSAQFDIKGIILEYPSEKRIKNKKNISSVKRSEQSYELKRYLKEYDYLRKDDQRKDFIVKFCTKIKNNTIILFNRVDYGKDIYKRLVNNCGKRVYYIDGSVKIDVRERIRENMEKYNDCIIVGSLRCLSTGINIKNVHNAILMEMGKSETSIVQTIGRILRKLPDKKATLYDISDDMSLNNFVNFSMRHFKKRVETYKKEHHNIKNVRIKL